jgi:3-deoxy-D-manno-octulosonate 8-phosphate phosphatase (KDO 8-P phosphatase)
MDFNPELTARLARVRILLMDVDGVLTDGSLLNIPGPDGQWLETKAFHSQDGLALQWLVWQGIDTGVISGRISPATAERARQLKMRYVYQGHLEKVPILQEIAAKSGVAPEQMAYVGDDLTDIVIMRRVGLGIAVANARAEVQQAAHWTTRAAGGHGAVREIAEAILKAQGLWPAILKKYEVEATA